VSSKADDFDVRYRDAGTAGHGGLPADGGYRGNAGDIDYDLGYDAPGWDTQGFRRPDADYLDSHRPGRAAGAEASASGGVVTAVRPDHGRTPHGRAHRSRPNGSHARAAGTAAGPAAGTEETSQLRWETEATGALLTPDLPGGPRRPQRPRGQRGGPRRRGPARPRVKVKGSWWRHWTLRKALGVLLGVIGAIIVLGAIGVAVAYEETPVPTAAMAATGFAQSVVYSSDGTLVGRFGTTNRQMLNYDQIPQTVINAVLAAEDRNFFNEGGVSPTGIVRAAYADLTGGDASLQGGSTITQEFVRQYYAGIGTQQTLSRKIKEIFVAMKVAKEKSKQWILTNYLNTIYLGEGAYGIGAAAQTYYHEPVSKLTPAQAAVIAAIIQQPSTYPLPQYRAQLKSRWHYVLNGMVQMGTLNAQTAAAMKFPAPGDHVPQSVGNDVWDPYVLNMVQTELEQVYHLSQKQIYNGGYVIRTTIDDKKMAALYKAVSDNVALINASSTVYPFRSYMRAGAVLEDPATGAIQAVYAGPGYPGSRYNGTGHRITAGECAKIQCQFNMAMQNREQVGSSFKPYILATAVKQGMNVQTSTLDGFNPLYIPLDTQPDMYGTSDPAQSLTGWYRVSNDSPAENGPYTPQIAMAVSINTAYADLWHVVAGPGGVNVVQMAKAFGVNTDAAGITAGPVMKDQAGIALGQASLTVAEQASMLATIDDNGVYHLQHVIASIRQGSAAPMPLKMNSYPVFSGDPTMNAEEASQVQYAMSVDDTSYGTAPVAAMSNGQEIIAKTGTTNTAQSAFFVGAIPSQALAVALFTHDQTGATGPKEQTLNFLGGQQQGGFGGTWPATIWHAYAENMFVPLGVEQFMTPVFTGSSWNEVPPNLRKAPKKHKKDHGRNGPPNPGGGGPTPFPTFSCDPTLVTCNPNGDGNGNGNTPTGIVPTTGALVGGIVAGLPATCLWARRRRRKQGQERG
jgi:membrane peptidoglycan carboxypeptidase